MPENHNLFAIRARTRALSLRLPNYRTKVVWGVFAEGYM